MVRNETLSDLSHLSGTPEEEAITLEEILMECTSFDLAGVMSKQSAEAMVEDVAHDVEGDEELPVSPGAPAVAAPAAVSDNAPPSTSQRILSGAAATTPELKRQKASWSAVHKYLDFDFNVNQPLSLGLLG